MKFTFSATPLSMVIGCSVLAGCAAPSLPHSPSHVQQAAPVAGRIPEPVLQQPPLPVPKPTRKQETYSVTVHKVQAQSLLFALARDAGLNVDVHPGIQGEVTLNALDQTLPQLLERIARQVDMRYEINGATLTVMPDTPVWRNYKIDYVNMARSTSSSVSIATQISTTGAGGSSMSNDSPASAAGGAGGNGAQSTASTAPAAQNSGSASGNNNSTTSVINRSDNNFWATLERNIRDMLRDTTLTDPDDLQASPAQPGGVATGAAALRPSADTVLNALGTPDPGNERTARASVIVNPESGLLAVRASGRQHQKIAEFLDIVMGAARRQVLIEATVIEVRLSDEYQQGIDWKIAGSKFTFRQSAIGQTALSSGVSVNNTPGLFSLNASLGDLTAAVQLLESFGTVKVLSSPKLSVMNNQTAMLKVVDNSVFFSIRVTPAIIGPNGTPVSQATYESRLETVPVGFVMSVTPQIADNDEVTLNVRPTITRIVGDVQDPNPALAAEGVISMVPVIQAREIESVLKVRSGDISVLGGLMQDTVDNARDSVPLVSRLPVVGNLFNYRNEQVSKTELVIFIRPVVVKNASVNGDFRDFRYLLPNQTTAPADRVNRP